MSTTSFITFGLFTAVFSFSKSGPIIPPGKISVVIYTAQLIFLLSYIFEFTLAPRHGEVMVVWLKPKYSLKWETFKNSSVSTR